MANNLEAAPTSEQMAVAQAGGTSGSGALLAALMALMTLACVVLSGPHYIRRMFQYNEGFREPALLYASPTPETLARGRALFSANCAACHGENAEGQDMAHPMGYYHDGKYLAPALNANGHATIHPTNILFFIAKFGSFHEGSPMVGWDGRLSDDDIASIVQWIRSTWPENIRAAQGNFINHCLP